MAKRILVVDDDREMFPLCGYCCELYFAYGNARGEGYSFQIPKEKR